MCMAHCYRRRRRYLARKRKIEGSLKLSTIAGSSSSSISARNKHEMCASKMAANIFWRHHPPAVKAWKEVYGGAEERREKPYHHVASAARAHHSARAGPKERASPSTSALAGVSRDARRAPSLSLLSLLPLALASAKIERQQQRCAARSMSKSL